MTEQPVPRVSDDDLVRLVRREFPRRQFEQVMRMLAAYDGGEHNRVCAAAIKLAEGKVKRLDHFLSTDYRDTLANAEYPGYLDQVPFSGPRPPDVQHIIDADWRQYREWFDR